MSPPQLFSARRTVQATAAAAAVGLIAYGILSGPLARTGGRRHDPPALRQSQRALALLPKFEDPKSISHKALADQRPIDANGLIRQEAQSHFFPFHVVAKGGCVSQRQILGVSQMIRQLLNNDIRAFPRNGFLLGIIRHGGFLPNENIDNDVGVVSSDLDKYRKPSKTSFQMAGCDFALEKTEDRWASWKGLDPANGRRYDFSGVRIRCGGSKNNHAYALYPYRDSGAFFYPFMSVDKRNHQASIADAIRYNAEGGNLRLLDADKRLDESNYQEGAQLGTVFDTELDCFTEKQFYFTTIPVPCDYNTILTSFYGRNWNHVENRGNMGETNSFTHESRAVSDEENEKLLSGGPRPICAS